MIYKIIISYLIGAIPFGLILAKLTKSGDLRTQGSGNIGATNAVRVMGKKLGAITLMLDMLKGLAVVLIFKNPQEPYIAPIAGLAAVIGHIFPIYIKFKGGKGVATALGVFLGLSLPVFLAASITWLITYKISRYSSVSSLVAIPFSAFVSLYIDPWIFIAHVVIALLVIYRHKENIRRLGEGKEMRV